MSLKRALFVRNIVFVAAKERKKQSVVVDANMSRLFVFATCKYVDFYNTSQLQADS
jgi:hypothetical protein